MDTITFIFHQMLNFSIPLLIVALGGMFSSRCGIINIGLDGIMIIGALASFMFIRYAEGYISSQTLLLLAILVSIVSGMIFSLLHAFASINLKANQIISGQALNMIAPAFSVFVARLFIGDSIISFKNTFMIEEIPFLSQIPVLGDLLFKNIYLTTYLGLLVLWASHFVLYKTRFGLRLRACGEYPQAPDSVGIDVQKIRYIGVLISGGLSGLGGLVFVLPNSTNFNGTVSGYGFLALAVMILGQWQPSKIFFASLFFGTLKTMSAIYSGIPFFNTLGIPGNYYKLMPYLITVIVLILGPKSLAGPKAEGLPFEKGMS
ncbi:ABC transporter permease [Pelolinea submarina]|uniref:Nucleoside ABC transporter membrane protein n=1 Tax=Pelolinea submarina TaxID=913107 RepID=A0A347ZQS2_9CHLR|nr:ABC transporter permease [Pelolinea submarina]REG11791.1 nucleoside ABC transporter membrane protein [Pelolinea submarina]BBB47653.1 simple sugar transport system permease protein [Pelolinea submarina]